MVTSGFLSVFQDFLLAFGGVALFVGSFVIANTMSITVAQRTRELATLRTLGATRRQVRASVMLEALVIGVLASVAGLFLVHTFAYFAHLGGLLFGFIYVKFMPRKGIAYGASESYFGFRNSYYRWKRRRAARKFEVYMRKHNREVTFDEHGNYVPPDDADKKNGGSKSGWVN